ncbi:hypothetical protein HGRIS_010878 [Hohenbuehelia grisea]|uniref:Uncharacterized protein n=1 Tax=Hohenbuehelia grisea TaxID=104357 RepID=A0ABR3IY80_9AGAR
MSDSSGLISLLTTSSSLSSVQLHGCSFPESDDSKPGPPTPWQTFLTDWKTRRVGISTLHALSLPLDKASLSMTSALIRLSAKSLRFLKLQGYSLAFSEFSALALLFSDRLVGQGLEELHIDVQTLSPQLMDIFATQLSSLQTLYIMYGRISTIEDGPWTQVVYDPIQQTYGPDSYGESMSNRLYDHWRLDELSLWQTGQSISIHAIEHSAMNITRRSIPRLKSITYPKRTLVDLPKHFLL